jgi:RNA polymerase sigma-70 factor (ECF subfamily)
MPRLDAPQHTDGLTAECVQPQPAVATRERLAELYPRAAPVIYRRALALLGDEEQARDAVQDLFVKLHHELDTFRGDAALLTWIYRVTTNHCLNRLRARRIAARALRVVAEQAGCSTSEVAKQLERRDLLRYLLGRFDPRKVQILVHLHYDGMTQSEIAQVVGISERAVRKTVARVSHRLDAELGSALDALQEEL